MTTYMQTPPPSPKLPDGTTDFFSQHPECEPAFSKLKSCISTGNPIWVRGIGTFLLRPKLPRKMVNRHGTFTTKKGFRLTLRPTNRASWLLEANERLRKPEEEPKKAAPKTSLTPRRRPSTRSSTLEVEA